MESNQSGAEETSVLSLLQKIKDGSKNPRDLEKEDRQRCVEAMVLEGILEPQIAQILERSEKTIHRDLADIRKRNPMSPSAGQAKELVGETQQQVRVQITRLTKIAVSRESTAAVKIAAEAMAWKIRDEFMRRLQTLGYLPLKPTEFVLTQQDEEKSFVEVEQTIADVRSAAQENGTLNPELEGKIQRLQVNIEKAKVASEAMRLLEQSKQSTCVEETNHESQL